jgi:hypothetical protein
MWVTGLGEQLLWPSPKFTQVFEIGSSSVAVKLILTLAPSFAEGGAVTITIGARSFTVSIAVLEPVPVLFVALTVTVKSLLGVVIVAPRW